jgi:acyl transferase domain-containing protein
MGDRGSHNDGDPAFLAPNFGDATMPIAVIGMGCRYPGGATDPEKLWKMCAEQRDAWSPVPKERFNQDAFYHPDPSRNGTVSH